MSGIPVSVSAVQWRQLTLLLEKIVESNEEIARRLAAIQFRLTVPGPIRIRVVGQGEHMRFMIEVDLPVATASDVASYEVTLLVPNEEPQVKTAAVGETVISGFTAPMGTVSAQCVEIDAAGNRSEAAEATAEVTDVWAPPKPGTFTIRTTGQVPD